MAFELPNNLISQNFKQGATLYRWVPMGEFCLSLLGELCHTFTHWEGWWVTS